MCGVAQPGYTHKAHTCGNAGVRARLTDAVVYDRLVNMGTDEEVLEPQGGPEPSIETGILFDCLGEEATP